MANKTKKTVSNKIFYTVITILFLLGMLVGGYAINTQSDAYHFLQLVAKGPTSLTSVDNNRDGIIDDSNALGSIPPSGWQRRISGSCGANKGIQAIYASGGVKCVTVASSGSGGCTPSCGSTSSACIGTTWSNGCGGTCYGTKNCGGCAPSCACSASTPVGSTCPDGCGGTCAGTKPSTPKSYTCGSTSCTAGGSTWNTNCNRDTNCKSCNCYNNRCDTRTWNSQCSRDSN